MKLKFNYLAIITNFTFGGNGRTFENLRTSSWVYEVRMCTSQNRWHHEEKQNMENLKHLKTFARNLTVRSKCVFERNNVPKLTDESVRMRPKNIKSMFHSSISSQWPNLTPTEICEQSWKGKEANKKRLIYTSSVRRNRTKHLANFTTSLVELFACYLWRCLTGDL